MTIPLQKFREVVFQLLYSYDMGQARDDHMLELLTKELSLTKKDVRDAQARVHLIRQHLPKIDTLIADTSHSYAFERIQSVERNILRLGVFELFFDPSIPPKVAIAEALRLAKKFSSKQSATFVNAILDALYQSSIGKSVDPVPLQQSSEELSQSESIAQKAANEQQPVEEDQ